MDFMHDQLSDGRTYRLFNVMDDYNREGLAIDANFSLPAERVIRSFEQLIDWRGKPEAIRCDNSAEYVSHKLMAWVKRKGIVLRCIQPGKPQKNAYVERYNRTIRYDWLSHSTICLNQSMKSKTLPPGGYGLTTINGQIWHSAK